MAWTWKRVETAEQAAEYVEVLQHRQDQYDAVRVEHIVEDIGQPGKGKQYWFGVNDRGVRAAFGVRCYPAYENVPLIQQMGVYEAERGNFATEFLRAVPAVYEQMRPIMARLREQYPAWQLDRYEIAAIKQVVGRALVAELQRLPGNPIPVTRVGRDMVARYHFTIMADGGESWLKPS